LVVATMLMSVTPSLAQVRSNATVAPTAYGDMFDVSDSMARFASAMTIEHIALLDALPDGARLLSWSVSDKPNVVADQRIDGASRLTLRDQFQTLVVKG